MGCDMPFRESTLNVDWNFSLQEGLISSRGTPVCHEKAVACTCVSTDPESGLLGSSDPTCPNCFGKGYMFRDPRRFLGLISNITADKYWSQVSWIQPGDLVFSPSIKARRISDFDRITIGMPTPFEGQVITRGVASNISPRPTELLPNEDYLHWEAGRWAAIWLEDEDGKTYRAGEYLLKGRKIEWSGNAGPAVGKKYSIKYEINPEYIAFVTPIDRWDRSRELGQRVMLRRATMDTNPANRQIRPPWLERVENNAFEGYDDPYTEYGDGGWGRKVDPQR